VLLIRIQTGDYFRIAITIVITEVEEIPTILLLLPKGRRESTNLRHHHRHQVHLPGALAEVLVAAAEVVAVAPEAGHREVTKRFINE
jgi:hypothetical protein